MKLVNLAKKQKKKRPLKISKTGLEKESHVINNDGSISYKGFWLSKQVKKLYPSIDIVKECGKNMVEINCYPGINTYNPALDLIKGMQKTIKIAKKNNLMLYPFGTYPGRYNPRFTPSLDGKYEIQEKIFGKEKFSLATKVVGFHHHYALPKGVFDCENRNIRLLVDSKLKRSLLNSYNFEIAIDPVLILFSQSSPFLDGKLLGKDARILAYRGGKKLNYEGMYNNFQQLGALPPYKQTATDLIRSLNKRKQRWKRLIKKASPYSDIKKLYPLDLDISWNPVKINKHGTLEHRGMDSNYMSVLLALSALVKFCLRKIQRDFIEVIPSDIGIRDPFRIKKGVMFIPPHIYVREDLQKAAAYEGYQNEALYEYAKKFYRFAKSLTPDFYAPLLKKIEDMLDKKMSVSDEIIAYAKRKGMITKKDTISNRSARIIALHFSKKYAKDLVETKRIVKQIMVKHKKSN